METSDAVNGEVGANLIPISAEEFSVPTSQGKRASERNNNVKVDAHTDDEELYDELMKSIGDET